LSKGERKRKSRLQLFFLFFTRGEAKRKHLNYRQKKKAGGRRETSNGGNDAFLPKKEETYLRKGKGGGRQEPIKSGIPRPRQGEKTKRPFRPKKRKKLPPISKDFLKG